MVSKKKHVTLGGTDGWEVSWNGASESLDVAAEVTEVTGGAWGWVRGMGLDREYLAIALEDFQV